MITALVLVSHSQRLALGVREIASQMAPDVPIRAVGGLPGGGLGTSFAELSDAVDDLVEQGHPVVMLTDLGSATMTAESVVEFLDSDAQVRVADAPLVEGSVAAAVAAQQCQSLDGVVAAAEHAWYSEIPAPQPMETPEPVAAEDIQPLGAADVTPAGPAAEPGTEQREVRLRNDMGLHARPAALVAQLAARYEADVTVNGANAKSVLSLLALGAVGGAALTVSARGPGAADATAAIAELIEGGFGEA